ncbi:D-2-hydroxyacid dehydrogenase [Mesobacterium pallidum]|uniref:D-2-hydroxyacid dehydrogenase n=1 Tax=Mesobacterium pallidum TaxID=2872037 RepID=UPI001EE36B8C|nr:D-2-hydroxyacid dehydrogenase [Mesobacterium pallidum]
MSAPAPTVFLTGEIDDARMEELRALAPGAELTYFADPAEMLPRIGEAEVIAGAVGPEALPAATRLKWVHSWAAGPNAQVYPAFVDSDVVLTSSKGNGAVPLAEHAMMLMLMLSRNAMRWIEAHQQGRWDRFFHGELNGATVGIIGTGHSGTDLAAKCKAFHMTTLGLRRSDRPAAHFDRMYTHDRLHDFLAASDYVVVTAPKTPETTGMLDAAAFRAMKSSAFYICFSRGGIADDDALFRAVDEGWIAGAGLDAHTVEPLPEGDRFWTLRNTIITPHNGATTTQTKTRGYEIFRDNLARYMRGEALANIVDKQLAY